MRFSIIIPVYNTEDYLRECLDSVLRQTESNWECICIDDGSKDSSGAICDEYAATDGRFKVVHQKNKGLTATRNVGLRIAQGDYVCFLDCDDARRDDWLEKANAVIHSTNADMVRMGYEIWRGEKYSTRLFDYAVETEVFRGKDEVFLWGWKTCNNIAYIWLSIYRRACLKDFQFQERRIYREDLVSSMRIIERIDSIAQYEYPACMYLVRPGSMMNSRIRVDELVGYWDEFSKIIFSRSHQLARLGLLDDAKVKFTNAVLGSLRNWMAWRSGEVEKYSVVARATNEYFLSGLIDLDVVKGVWGWAFNLYCKKGLEFPLYSCEKLALIYHRVKRGLKVCH